MFHHFQPLFHVHRTWKNIAGSASMFINRNLKYTMWNENSPIQRKELLLIRVRDAIYDVPCCIKTTLHCWDKFY